MSNSCAETLRLAIVKQAVLDYIQALNNIKVKSKRDNYQAEKVKNECELFFRSQWFVELCGIDGKKMILYLNTNDLKKVRGTLRKMIM